MSVSPKLANSDPRERAAAVRAEHAARRLDVPTLRRLLESYACQLKFVVAEPADVREIEDLLARLPPVAPDAVLLMALGTTAADVAARGRWIAELCKERGWRYTPRLHIDLFGNERGT
jgi:7-carboxy-7-deazaguanine synthase